MPRLDTLSEMVRKVLLSFPCLEAPGAPWTPPPALPRATLALVTTAGLHLRGDHPFVSDPRGGDSSFRVIPSSARAADILQSHASIGFDHTAFYRDMNVTLPLDRVHELAARGTIGAVAPRAYSFMGAIRDPRRLVDETGPEVAQRLRDDGAQVVLLTPTWPFCTHAVGVLARVFEGAGLSTVGISLVREHTVRVRPPRALFVPFPFGFAMGKPGDPALQHRVLGAALALLERPAGPVLDDFPEDEAPLPLPQASALPSGAPPAVEPADELTALRPFYERWVESHGGRTAVGVSGVRQRRWRGVVRLLEAYARGEEADLPERPADLPLPQFIRYCVDDLKAFYYEARMEQRADVAETELHTWFWTETAMGRLVPQVGARMAALDDPAAKAIAYGIAR